MLSRQQMTYPISADLEGKTSQSVAYIYGSKSTSPPRPFAIMHRRVLASYLRHPLVMYRQQGWVFSVSPRPRKFIQKNPRICFVLRGSCEGSMSPVARGPNTFCKPMSALRKNPRAKSSHIAAIGGRRRVPQSHRERT